MTETPGGAGAATQEWRLRGFWYAWIWISWAVCAVLLVGGLGLVTFGRSATGVVPLVLGVGTLLVAIAAVIGWQLTGTALAVSLDPDGAITVRRQRGALHTHTGRVRRLRPSALRSPPYTPTVLETADGSALLVHPRPDLDEVVTAFRRRNPDIVVDI